MVILKKYSVVFYALAAGLISIFLMEVLYRFQINLYQSMHYHGDYFLMGMLTKSIIDTGWYTINPYLSAPYAFNFLDFPLVDLTNIIIIKLLTLFSDNYAVVINLFFLLTFPIAAVSAFFVYFYLGLKKPTALVAAILFTFLPYHFYRGEGHLFLSSYFSIPIYVWFAYLVFQCGPFLQPRKHTISKLVGYSLLAVIVASSGVYYAFFGLYIILVAGVVASINSKRWLPLCNAIIFTLIISFTVLANSVPSLNYWHKEGHNKVVGVRQPQEAEIYGFRIAQFFIPANNHHVKPFAAFKVRYEESIPLPTEARDSASGLIASAGFIFLIGYLFVRRRFVNDSLLYFSSILVASSVLLATIGGFGSLFSYLVSAQIRAYNRISIFIAFVCLLGFFAVFERLAPKRSTLFLLCGLFVFGMWDEARFNNWVSPIATKAVMSDKAYVDMIEKTLPSGALVFNLPYIDFPEAVEGYLPMRQYLHSHTLKWSYPAMKGRAADEWQSKVSKLPVNDMLKKLAFTGFSGISISTSLHPEENVKLQKALNAVLRTKPIFSIDREFAFYDLREYIKKLRHSMGEDKWKAAVAITDKMKHVQIIWRSGFGPEESLNNLTWRWSNKKGELRIVNSSDRPIKMHMQFTLSTGYIDFSDIEISGNLMHETVKSNQQGSMVDKVLVLMPGVNAILFATNAERVLTNSDPRILYFRINNFKASIL